MGLAAQGFLSRSLSSNVTARREVLHGLLELFSPETKTRSLGTVFFQRSRMIALRFPQLYPARTFNLCGDSRNLNSLVVCGARGPRPRYPRVWKSQKRIGTISKSQKLFSSIKGLSNVKEEVYGALDSFVAWDLEFPLIVVKKALKMLEAEKEWKRIIQVIKWMLSKGQGKTMGSYYTLLNALAEDGRLDEAEELWTRIFSRNLESLPRVFFGKMISIYYKHDMHEKMFEVFADMEELGVIPDKSIVVMMGNVFQKLGMQDKYERLHKKYPPPKWEYRYIKGQRVRIKKKHLIGSDGEEAESNLPDHESESFSEQDDQQFMLHTHDHTVQLQDVEQPNLAHHQ